MQVRKIAQGCLIGVALWVLQGSASATIVNIDGTVSGCTICGGMIAPGTVVTMINPVVLTLGPGTYNIANAATIYSVEAGANPGFTAFNVQAGRSDGWAWNFIFAADNGNGTATTINSYGVGYLTTSQLAMASESGVTTVDGYIHVVPGLTSTAGFHTTFTLASTTKIEFGILDYYLPDNAAGVALDVSPVPVPGAVWLLTSGLGMMGWVASGARKKLVCRTD